MLFFDSIMTVASENPLFIVAFVGHLIFVCICVFRVIETIFRS